MNKEQPAVKNYLLVNQRSGQTFSVMLTEDQKNLIYWLNQYFLTMDSILPYEIQGDPEYI